MNRFLRTLLVTTVCAIPLAVHSQPDTVRVSLQQVMERALEVSPDLEAVRAGARYADARSRLARASRFLTELEVITAFAVVPGLTNPNDIPVDQLYLDPAVRNDYSNLKPYSQSELQLLQPLYSFGALSGAVRAATLGAKAEVSAVHTKEQAVALRTAVIYYDVLLADALLGLANQATDVVTQAKREINRLLEEGDPEVDDADNYQVLITEQALRHRIVEVTELRLLAATTLSRQMLFDGDMTAWPEEDALTPIPFMPLPLDEYMSLAIANRPELAQARAGLRAHEALVHVARADYYPQIIFGFSAMITGASNRHRQPNPFISDGFRRSVARTGIGFRQKLNFGQTKARVAQAREQASEVRHTLDAAEQLVYLEVEQAYRQLTIADAALAAQDSSLAISKEWLRVETINFDLDLGSTENLIDAVQTNLELEASYLEAIRRYNVTVLRLLHAAGMLTRTAL